jgi:hypothetical protein
MVSGDTPQSLQAGLAQVAWALYSNIDPATTDDIRERATLEWLSKNSGWLLIVDNADSQAARDGIVERFSQWANGHVLITARFQSWPHSVEPVDMHVLSPEMGARFLLRSTDGKRQSAVDDEQQARELAEKDLDGLCLALEQAAAYIAEREISLAEYRQRWAKNERQARTWADKWMMQYHTEREVSLSVATTWITTFEELPEASKQLLRMLSWLSPEPIPRGLLESCSNTIRLTPDARPSSSPLPPGEGPGVRAASKPPRSPLTPSMGEPSSSPSSAGITASIVNGPETRTTFFRRRGLSTSSSFSALAAMAAFTSSIFARQAAR